MGNTVITSYIVDSYPFQSMSVITFYSVFLNLSAFIDPVNPLSLPFPSSIKTPTNQLTPPPPQFFIAPWQATNGFTWAFAAQGILTFFLAVPAIAGLHRFGPRLRAISGQPGWVNPEYNAA